MAEWNADVAALRSVGLSVAQWLYIGNVGTRRHRKGTCRIGTPGVEARQIADKMLHKPELVELDPLHDAPGQFVAAVIVVMGPVPFLKGKPGFFRPKRFLALPWLAFGYLYLAAMLLRAVLVMDRPSPIVFHVVLAAFILVVGESHRQRLKHS